MEKIIGNLSVAGIFAQSSINCKFNTFLYLVIYFHLLCSVFIPSIVSDPLPQETLSHTQLSSPAVTISQPNPLCNHLLVMIIELDVHEQLYHMQNVPTHVRQSCSRAEMFSYISYAVIVDSVCVCVCACVRV